VTEFTSRPLNNDKWQVGQPAKWRQAWAYDGNGDPYITGRVQVTKWDPTTNAPAQPESRSDEIVKVYLQNNLSADIPFKVNILPVRLTGDEWEIRSAVGGAGGGTNGNFVLYDWHYGTAADPWPPARDLPGGYDGVWPATPGEPGQATDPRVIRIRPNDPDKNLTMGWIDWLQPPPDENMGIVRDVLLRRGGPVALRDAHVVTALATPSLDSADLTVKARVRNDSDAAVTTTVVFTGDWFMPNKEADAATSLPTPNILVRLHRMARPPAA